MYIVHARTGQHYQHDDTVVSVLEIRGAHVLLGFSAPRWALEQIEDHYLPATSLVETLNSILERDIEAQAEGCELLTGEQRRGLVEYLAAQKEVAAERPRVERYEGV